MNATNARLGVFAYALVLLALLAATAEPAGAQSVEAGTPANATANAYGSGWQCDRGFRNVDGTCLAVTVPANAFLTGSYGSGWACSHGYKQDNDACDPLVVPANAYISAASGDR